jgi:hypothetical protein
MSEIRILLPDDFPAIKKVLDSRDKVQFVVIRNELIPQRNYIMQSKLRGGPWTVFGWFDDAGELQAVRSFYAWPDAENYSIGNIHTQKGYDFQERNVNGFAMPIFWLQKFATEYYRMRHYKALWGIWPVDKRWIPLDRSPDSDLMNTEKWNLEQVGLIQKNRGKFIKAEGMLEDISDEYVRQHIMGGTYMPIDQLVFRVTDLNPVPLPPVGETAKAKMPPKPKQPFVQTFEHPPFPIVNT